MTHTHFLSRHEQVRHFTLTPSALYEAPYARAAAAARGGRRAATTTTHVLTAACAAFATGGGREGDCGFQARDDTRRREMTCDGVR